MSEPYSHPLQLKQSVTDCNASCRWRRLREQSLHVHGHKEVRNVDKTVHKDQLQASLRTTATTQNQNAHQQQQHHSTTSERVLRAPRCCRPIAPERTWRGGRCTRLYLKGGVRQSAFREVSCALQRGLGLQYGRALFNVARASGRQFMPGLLCRRRVWCEPVPRARARFEGRRTEFAAA